MLTFAMPAPIFPALELARDARDGLKPWQRRGLTQQLLHGDTVACSLEGRLLAVGGFYPCDPEMPGEEIAETWFMCRPELASHLLPFVRLTRLTMRRVSHHGPVRLRAFVRDGHAPGRRLARLLGFHLVEPGLFERWEWRSRPDGAVHPEADGGRQQQGGRAG